MTDTSQITEVTDEDRTADSARPEKFDFAQWMAGFQPTRKACVLYGRTDLLAVIDRLDEEARLPGLTDEQKKELLTEAQETLEVLKASGVEFVVQTMSVYAQKELMERLGHKTKDDPVTHEMECAFLAAHIVEHYYALDFTIDGIREDYIFNETCQHTVPQAIECFLESCSFEDAIRTAISLGGDSDTIAAITGAIAEAYYGIPGAIRTQALSYLDDRLRPIYDEWEARYGTGQRAH